MILKIVWCLAQPDLKLDNASNWIRQGNIDTLLKTTSDGGIKLPWHIRRAKHQDPIIIIADSLHLHEELSLDPARRLILALAAGPAE